MKNYKMNLKYDSGIYFFKENEYNLKVEKLKQMGFYNNCMLYYEKSYSIGDYESIKISLITNGYFLRYYYSGSYYLPIEMTKEKLGKEKYKKIMNVLREDIKKLKEYQIIK
jgi:hypothetical protein